MTDQRIEHLFKTYYTLLFRVAYDMLHDEDESHDAVHDVFAAILKKDVALRPDEEKNFLTRCIHNHCANLLLRKGREAELKKQYPRELSVSLRGRQEEEQRLRMIYEFVEKEMPPDTRKVFELCYEEEKSYEETASILNYSVAYVNKHIVKALKMLRERFNPSKPSLAVAAGICLVVGVPLAMTLPRLLNDQPRTEAPALSEETSLETTAETSFIFHDVTLQQVLDTLSTYYHVNVIYNNKEAAQLRLYTQIEKDLELSEAVSLLNQLGGMSLRIENEDTLIVE